MNRPKWFADSWGCLAKSVIEVALEDLNPVPDAAHLNLKKLKADAESFFEGKWALIWGKAAGFNRNDIEQAYLDTVGKGEQDT